MTGDKAWQIFKNTGSVEAYITYAQTKNLKEENADDNENKRDHPENQ